MASVELASLEKAGEKDRDALVTGENSLPAPTEQNHEGNFEKISEENFAIDEEAGKGGRGRR